MDELASGQCLCGVVTFQISGEFESFFLCHCMRCRKDSGSAHAANLFSSTAKIVWLSGVENIREFRLAGSQHVKCFCTNCGSGLPFNLADDAALVVPAGSLDTPIALLPNAHIYYASRAAWDNDLGSLDIIEGRPG
ncbi:GFA family protein [Roseibacterium sp. SDUM158017]|uniref:GFA family protein n=1 Tax=Roseicyclus salinarum TaxID=3036773 RepID=UPI002415831C|nr:GFA family protein [Roseibacterium sp. SDUM158017]MDG4648696.1 GFA family protein [Roseibacterium sp. SDUM158017]